MEARKGGIPLGQGRPPPADQVRIGVAGVVHGP